MSRQPTQPGRWCVIDLETTGLYPNGHDRVLEIGVISLDDRGSKVAEWQSLVNPQRDVGPTRVHGITAGMAQRAPTFAELCGDLMEVTNGCRLVAHNARFELSFLEAEFRRLGVVADDLDALCTMRLCSQAGIGRSLEACCLTLEIENSAPHTAYGDALATAALFTYLRSLGGGGDERGDRSHARFALQAPRPVAFDASIEASGSAVTRSEVRGDLRPLSYVVRLSAKLPEVPCPKGVDPAIVDAYSEVLDRALEDRVIDRREIEDLGRLASGWGLSVVDVEAINLNYFRGLLAVAYADGAITEHERNDLEHTAALLGVDEDTARSSLADPESAAPEAARGFGGEFEGMSVCFTGMSTCTVNGQRLSRGLAAEMAEAAGLAVRKGVTRDLDILVVADPDTLSGKARKARDYGTRIIAERSFWPRAGIVVD